MAEGSDAEVCRHLARGLGIPFVDLERYEISPGLLCKIPRDVALWHRAVPLVFNARRIVLVVDRPAEALLLDARIAKALAARTLEVGAAPRIEFALGTARGLDRALARRLQLRG